ncbi:UpxY family transcription antiterminator [Psychroflexus planctonicus]|uniref:Transcription antitermination protein NusG n=1 Tax=Psychroflexus planctonicus TaxID=1526575 RepID=A0ABQ1SHQ8_9FLAO|nr:UpxY family transcription antiterminator [Psychroflexus planctonicus]GGE40030.1 transcription antitermination protein NusG [Psychroflexus planctonicus]
MNTYFCVKLTTLKIIEKEDEQWLVLYTKPNTSRNLAKQLNTAGIEAYCPTKTEVRQWSDRKKKVQVPVLPSMILVKAKPSNRQIVFEFNGALRFLFWAKKPAIVSEREVEALRDSLEKPNVVSAEVEAIKPGQKIDLSELGFEGQEGNVKYVSGNKCWVILESLGFVVKVNLSKEENTKQKAK